jgi:hypothetical protein
MSARARGAFQLPLAWAIRQVLGQVIGRVLLGTSAISTEEKALVEELAWILS